MNAGFATQLLHLYAYPRAAHRGPKTSVGECQLETLLCPETAIAAAAFACSFDQAIDRLQQLERMFVELDGSFVWAGENRAHDLAPVWQLDGMLYDDGATAQTRRTQRLLPTMGMGETARLF